MSLTGGVGGRPHPAQKALNVWRSRTKPCSTETSTHQPSSVLLGRRRAGKSQRPGLQTNFIPPDAPEGRVLRRLLDSYHLLRDPVEQIIYPGIRHHHHRATQGQTVHVVPHDPIKVPTCCNHHKEQVRDEAGHHRRYLYNSPTPMLPDLKHSNKPYDRLERLSEQNLRTNERRQLPLSTVVVRWRNTGSKQSVRAYDTESLYHALSASGPITAIYTTSPNSAYVIFADLTDACTVIEERTLGRADNRLYCHWMHKNMSSKLFYLTAGGVRVRHDDFIQPSR